MAWPAVLAALGMMSQMNKKQQPVVTGRGRVAQSGSSPFGLSSLSSLYGSMQGGQGYGEQSPMNTLQALQQDGWMNEYLMSDEERKRRLGLWQQ